MRDGLVGPFSSFYEGDFTAYKNSAYWQVWAVEGSNVVLSTLTSEEGFWHVTIDQLDKFVYYVDDEQRSLTKQRPSYWGSHVDAEQTTAFDGLFMECTRLMKKRDSGFLQPEETTSLVLASILEQATHLPAETIADATAALAKIALNFEDGHPYINRLSKIMTSGESEFEVYGQVRQRVWRPRGQTLS